MTSKKPCLIWLDDVPSSVQKLIDFARQRFEVFICRNPKQFEDKVEGNDERRKVFVIDIMLENVADLSNITGLEDQDTDTQSGFDAGWVVLSKWLRRPETPYKDVPVCILTSLQPGEESEQIIAKLNGRGGIPIKIIWKNPKTVEGEFRMWIDSLDLAGG